MDIYTPLFAKIIDSSIWDEPDSVRIVFITLLAKKDADMIVRASAYQISKWSRKTEEEVLKALKVLSSPDKRRIEPQPHEGRRIQRVEEGWLLLNGQYYQDLMRKVHRNSYQAAKQKEYRQKKKGTIYVEDEAAKTRTVERLAQLEEERAENHSSNGQ